MQCIKCSAELPAGAIFCPFCGKKQTASEKKRSTRSRPNGTGSAYRRGKTWECAVVLGYAVQDDGKVKTIRRTKGGFRTKKEAMEYLEEFLCCGRQGAQSVKRLDWKLDSDLILSDVNKVACCEIRQLPFVHWWTFLAWFHAIGPGQLSTVVGIRDKLARGIKLESWEQEYYRQNRDRIQMRQPLSAQEREEKEKLEKLLS